MLKYDPDGPQRIIGALPAPDWPALIEGLRERVDIGRVDGGGVNVPRALADLLTTETIEAMLSEVGGWERIVCVAQEVKRTHQRMWHYIEDPPAVMARYQEVKACEVKRLLLQGVLRKIP